MTGPPRDGPASGVRAATEQAGGKGPSDGSGTAPRTAGGTPLDRRALLRGVAGVTSLAAVAGCLNPFVPDGFEATPYGLPPPEARASGYTTTEHHTSTIDRDVPQASPVTIESHLVAYRGDDAVEPAPLATLSTPKATVLGEPRNPLAGTGVGDLVREPSQFGLLSGLVNELELLPRQFDGWELTPQLLRETAATAIADERSAAMLFAGRAQSTDVLFGASRITTGGDIVLVATGRAWPVEDGDSNPAGRDEFAVDASATAFTDVLPTVGPIDPSTDLHPVDSGNGDDGTTDDGDPDDETGRGDDSGGDGTSSDDRGDDGSGDEGDPCLDAILEGMASHVTTICYDEKPSAETMAEWINDVMGWDGVVDAGWIRDGGETPSGKTISRAHSSALFIVIVTPCYEGIDADHRRNEVEGESPRFTSEAARQLHRHELGHAAGFYLSWAILRCLDKGGEIPLSSDEDPSFNERYHRRTDDQPISENRQDEADPTSDYVEAATEATIEEIVQEVDGVSRADVEECLEEVCG